MAPRLFALFALCLALPASFAFEQHADLLSKIDQGYNLLYSDYIHTNGAIPLLNEAFLVFYAPPTGSILHAAFWNLVICSVSVFLPLYLCFMFFYSCTRNGARSSFCLPWPEDLNSFFKMLFCSRILSP